MGSDRATTSFPSALLESSFSYCYDRGNGQYTRLVPLDLLSDRATIAEVLSLPERQSDGTGMIVLPVPQGDPLSEGTPMSQDILEEEPLPSAAHNEPRLIDFEDPPAPELPEDSGLSQDQLRERGSYRLPHQRKRRQRNYTPYRPTGPASGPLPIRQSPDGPDPGPFSPDRRQTRRKVSSSGTWRREEGHYRNTRGNGRQRQEEYGAPPPGARHRGPKTYCSKWLFEGTCAFEQVGCKYKHEMPHDKATQIEVGLNNGYPSWYSKCTAEESRPAPRQADEYRPAPRQAEEYRPAPRQPDARNRTSASASVQEAIRSMEEDRKRTYDPAQPRRPR